jgi:hypothetical protein
MRININKYKEFLKESLDPWKLKIGIKSFNKQKDELLTIPGDLKELSKTLNSELSKISLPYYKLIEFGGIELDLIIREGNNYYSNINWDKFLKGDYELIVNIPKDYDIDYLVSLIIHEIRHMIDFTDENLNSGISSFDMELSLRKYNIENFREFYTLIYLSLEHELVARNNQIYPYIKFKNLTKEESLSIVKKSFIWEALQKLRSFDPQNFIKGFEIDVLINITNSFIKDVLSDNENRVENLEELVEFYNLFNDYFVEISNKWEHILLNEVDRIWERKVYMHTETIGWEAVLVEIWKEIRKNS